jgi:hypothetical protein
MHNWTVGDKKRCIFRLCEGFFGVTDTIRRASGQKMSRSHKKNGAKPPETTWPGAAAAQQRLLLLLAWQAGARAPEGFKRLLLDLAATRSGGRGKMMATPLPPLRRATATATLLPFLLLAAVLASTARADLVISKADRRVSAVQSSALLQISEPEPSSHLSPLPPRLSALGSNAARVSHFCLSSLQVDLTSHIVRVLASLKVRCSASALFTPCFPYEFAPACWASPVSVVIWDTSVLLPNQIDRNAAVVDEVSSKLSESCSAESFAICCCCQKLDNAHSSIPRNPGLRAVCFEPTPNCVLCIA